MAGLKYLFSLAAIIFLWALLSLHFGENLIPSPASVGREGIKLLSDKESWGDILITIYRGVTGLIISFAAGMILGIPCGLNRKVMDILSPLVIAAQGCPPIIWISLLMVWVGMSSVIPVVVIIVSLFPVIFYNIAQGVASLEDRLFSMARIYRVDKVRILKEILLPGIMPYILSSLSYSLSVAWKVTATAEFLGSPAGIGSRLYWAYRYLDMPQIFFWAVVLIIIGFTIEMFVIQPVREGNRNNMGGAV